MNARNARTAHIRTATPLALLALSLALTLAACGGGTTTPPGTPVTTLTDSGAGSLREALTAAAPGDTLRLTQKGTLTLTAPLLIDKNVTVIATGVTIDAAGKGRALDVASGATVTVRGGTLKGGVGAVLPARLNAARMGALFGPARMEPAARVRASRVGAQAATPIVGGVLINHGTLTLDGVIVTGGRANIGGGIYNDAGATLTLSDGASVTGNAADLIDPNDNTVEQGIGGGVYTRGILNVSGGSVSGNTTTYSGGGVYGGAGSSITLSSGKIDGNTTTYPVTVNGTVTQGASGGGISTVGDLTVSGGSVSENSTSYFGGGITVQGTCANADCTSVTRPAVMVTGGVIENNHQTDTTSVGGGGGIWSSGNTTVAGGTIRGNTSDYGAGVNAWYNTDITGGVIEGNQARQAGAGIIFLNANRAYHIGGTAQISGNAAIGSGGGIHITRSAQVTMDGGSITGNKVTGTTDGGGGVRVSGGSTFTLAGGAITGNTAVKTGGGVTVGGSVAMTGGSITGNAVTNRTDGQGGGGGGVRLYAGASMTASGGTISNNTAWFGGGMEINGAYASSPTSTFVLSGATISGNRADGLDGGGVWNDGSLTIQSGSVTGNSARAGGGVFSTRVGIYAQPGGSVSGNTPDNVFKVP